MKQKTPISWHRRGRRFAWAILTLGVISANGIASARTDDLPKLDQKAPEFTDTQVAARVHLDQFFQSVIGDDGVAQMGAAVRVALPTHEGRHILVWITPFAVDDDAFYGAPANPTASSSPTELITFDRSQVVDWSFVGQDGLMYGNFATRLVLHTVLPSQAAEIAAILSDSPAPEEWLQ